MGVIPGSTSNRPPGASGASLTSSVIDEGNINPSLTSSLYSLPVDRYLPSGNAYPSGPSKARKVVPTHIRPLEEYVNLRAHLLKQLKQEVDKKWAAEEIDTVLNCLDDENLAREEGIEILVRTKGTGGKLINIVPPDEYLSEVLLNICKETVRGILVAQKNRFTLNSINYDERINQLGHTLVDLANQQRFPFSFHDELQSEMVAERAVDWIDEPTKFKVTMLRCQPEASGIWETAEDQHEHEVRIRRTFRPQPSEDEE